MKDIEMFVGCQFACLNCAHNSLSLLTNQLASTGIFRLDVNRARYSRRAGDTYVIKATRDLT